MVDCLQSAWELMLAAQQIASCRLRAEEVLHLSQSAVEAKRKSSQ